ncbi:uncharacterized protein DEA37_0013322 [Paragonimus westermani]|uniref:Ras-GEF domain-containing protein n=1 Tax=Paragonimus westermani TaxID=34504 RepID=A0A5J4NRC5_9TREM|nr:uncharacterized protein DEA37_0013322 [Paragonimus westermani]
MVPSFYSVCLPVQSSLESIFGHLGVNPSTTGSAHLIESSRRNKSRSSEPRIVKVARKSFDTLDVGKDRRHERHLKVNPELLAQQMTLIELKFFQAIKPEEFISLKWNGKEKLKYAPNIVASTRWFNQIIFWVQKDILNEQSLSKRTEVMSHFIRIAKKLVELNNYSSAMAIVSGLQIQCVYRLAATWAALSSRDRNTFRKLSELFSQEQNYTGLRTAFENTRLPCIPYLAFVRDDKIASYLEAQRYIEELQRFIEDANYKLSLRLEPPAVDGFSPPKTESACTLQAKFALGSSVLKPIPLYPAPSSASEMGYRSLDRRHALVPTTVLSMDDDSDGSNRKSVKSATSSPPSAKSAENFLVSLIPFVPISVSQHPTGRKTQKAYMKPCSHEAPVALPHRSDQTGSNSVRQSQKNSKHRRMFSWTGVGMTGSASSTTEQSNFSVHQHTPNTRLSESITPNSSWSTSSGSTGRTRLSHVDLSLAIPPSLGTLFDSNDHTRSSASKHIFAEPILHTSKQTHSNLTTDTTMLSVHPMSVCPQNTNMTNRNTRGPIKPHAPVRSASTGPPDTPLEYTTLCVPNSHSSRAVVVPRRKAMMRHDRHSDLSERSSSGNLRASPGEHNSIKPGQTASSTIPHRSVGKLHFGHSPTNHTLTESSLLHRTPPTHRQLVPETDYSIHPEHHTLRTTRLAGDSTTQTHSEFICADGPNNHLSFGSPGAANVHSGMTVAVCTSSPNSSRPCPFVRTTAVQTSPPLSHLAMAALASVQIRMQGELTQLVPSPTAQSKSRTALKTAQTTVGMESTSVISPAKAVCLDVQFSNGLRVVREGRLLYSRSSMAALRRLKKRSANESNLNTLFSSCSALTSLDLSHDCDSTNTPTKLCASSLEHPYTHPRTSGPQLTNPFFELQRSVCAAPYPSASLSQSSFCSFLLDPSSSASSTISSRAASLGRLSGIGPQQDRSNPRIRGSSDCPMQPIVSQSIKRHNLSNLWLRLRSKCVKLCWAVLISSDATGTAPVRLGPHTYLVLFKLHRKQGDQGKLLHANPEGPAVGTSRNSIPHLTINGPQFKPWLYPPDSFSTRRCTVLRIHMAVSDSKTPGVTSVLVVDSRLYKAYRLTQPLLFGIHCSPVPTKQGPPKLPRTKRASVLPGLPTDTPGKSIKSEVMQTLRRLWSTPWSTAKRRSVELIKHTWPNNLDNRLHNVMFEGNDPIWLTLLSLFSDFTSQATAPPSEAEQEIQSVGEEDSVH